METNKQTPENYIKGLRRKSRRIFSTELKIAIVVEGMRAENSVKEICRKYGIVESLFYKWNKEFFEAGKQRLSGDEVRQATSDEVSDLRKENAKLKEALADLMIRCDILKKTMQYLG